LAAHNGANMPTSEPVRVPGAAGLDAWQGTWLIRPFRAEAAYAAYWRGYWR